jgi:hypothetical protein
MTSIKNLIYESNWPYLSCAGSTIANGKPINVTKILPMELNRLPLGVNVYSPQEMTKKKAVLSHHFVPNTFKEQKFDSLSIIQSMGEQEYADSPLNIKSSILKKRDPGFQTPISRFATPSNSGFKNALQGSMTPQACGSKKRGSESSREEGISEFEKLAGKRFEKKKTLPLPDKEL